MSDREQKDESREMVADIVKELRRQSDSEGKLATQLRKTDDDVDFALASCYAEDAKYLSKIADRIEAAWKRELEKVEADALSVGGIVEAARHKPVGNAAAMREALERLYNKIVSMQCDTSSQKRKVDECRMIIRKMLSLPPRNCDINLSAESLWDKFEDYMHDCGLPFYSEPSGKDAFDWLLATATEKGECYGK